ncbi:MAG: glycosyltransferase [Rhodobacteraceae bacterium]|nr:glycosyltransferase [Paracoccaceae bacterium]
MKRHLGGRSGWLPNLADRPAPPDAAAIRGARAWLDAKLTGGDAPVWILPCRSLRRKNMAEALLLTRWLRPEAWLVITGAASSRDEEPYVRSLEAAAHRHHWRVRFGVLAVNEPRKPSVPELLAASEAVLLTSIQEGFGLPYLEAVAAGRPLIARRLPNVSPDLHRFGFRFAQAYDEVFVSPPLFDWKRERARQENLFGAWLRQLPAPAGAWPAGPRCSRPPDRGPVPFSRLTLTAQLEVLSHPVRESRSMGLLLNPHLESWRHRAATGRLEVASWPRTADHWLGGVAYGRRFWQIVATGSRSRCRSIPGQRIQNDFIRNSLGDDHLFPLLWNTTT